MANDDWIAARGGLLPLNFPFGNYSKNYYLLTTGAAAHNIFIGQTVDLDANGRAVAITIGSNNLTIGTVVGFTDTNLAALPSVMHSLSQGAYLPGNNDGYGLVADDPNQEFVIQEDTGGTALTTVAGGLGAWVTYRSSSGNTTTGYSTLEVDRSVTTTGTDGLVQLLRPLEGPINSDGTLNAPGNYCKWVVKIMNHRLGGGAKFQTPV